MAALLEFIFQGFFEWVYSLILEIWNYFSSTLLSVMSLDFAYLKTHIPVMGDIQQIILAVGWALLLGNLVFQAVRSMASGLGFEGEDPKLLFARTFVFAFLLLASPQICETVLGITSDAISLLEIPDAINVQLVDGSVFGVFAASWILVIIFDLITMFMVLSLLLEVAERYMVLAMLTLTAPLAFAMGGSKSTSEIFTGWCRMFGSMCFLMATNVVFFKMLLSVVSTVPSFPDVFLWMVLIVSIVKVAKKADEIITRIGLNPAITGGKSTLPGVIAYTVFRTALSMVTKGAATGIGGALGLAGQAASGAGKGKSFAGSAARSGGIAAQVAGGPRYGGGRTQTRQSDSQQEHSQHTAQKDVSQTQNASQRQVSAQDRTQRTGSDGFRPGQASRKTSMRPGTRRGSSYVTPPDGQHKTEEKSTSHRDASSGFTGIHGPQGGGFTGMGVPCGGGFGGAGAKTDAPRGGGAFGNRPNGTPRGPGFGGTFSKTTQKTEISQSRPAGTGTPPTTGKPGVGTPGSQSGTAGMGTRSTQRPPISEPRHGRNAPPASATLTTKAQGSSPVQQEQRQTSEKGKPPAKGGGSVPRPGIAGTGTPSTAGKPGAGTPGPQSGTAGRPPRSTQRPPGSEPRHSRNVPARAGGGGGGAPPPAPPGPPPSPPPGREGFPPPYPRQGRRGPVRYSRNSARLPGWASPRRVA